MAAIILGPTLGNSIAWATKVTTSTATSASVCQAALQGDKGSDKTVDSKETKEVKEAKAKELARLKKLTPAQAWNETQKNLEAIQQAFIGEGIESIFFGLMVGAVSKEFIWINGDPGGAKTTLAKTVYENLLAGLPYESKRNFFIQFHKLMTENVITGTPKIKSMLQGLYERNFEDSLVNSAFRTLIADEIDKSHTGLQAAMLSLLAERAAFVGDQVVKAGLETGAFTSNKTLGQLMESYGPDAPTGEALLDRMALKTHSVNKQLDEFHQWEMFKAVNLQKKLPVLPLPLVPIRQMAKGVVIPDSLLRDFAQVANEMDISVISKRQSSLDKQIDPNNEELPYFPANQFSNRSWRKILGIAQASFIVEQLMDGVPYDKIRYTMERRDLHHLATASAYMGPGRIQRKSVEIGPVTLFTSMTDLQSFKGRWFPSTGTIVLKAENGVGKIKLNLSADHKNVEIRGVNLGVGTSDQINRELLIDQVLGAIEEAKSVDAKKAIIENPVGFAEDPVFKRYLELRNLPKNTMQEIASIQEDQAKLIRLMNDQLPKPEDTRSRTKEVRTARAHQLREARKTQREFKSLAQNKDNVTPESMWPINQKTLREVMQTFPEMEHVVKAMVLAMATDSNAYLFGPPGGAKTAISRALIDAELRTENQLGVALFINRFLKKFEQDHPKEFKLFLLQCHQLMPEGQIVGFQNIDAQLERDGKLEWNAEDSLAGRKFLYAIIDEVEKAHSAVAATLLSMLEERAVLGGAQKITATVLAIVLTSNKTPSEFLEMYDIKDRPTGEALLNRLAIKAYVPNKFANEDVLVEYLTKLKNGLNPIVHGPLALNYVKPLIDKAKQQFLQGDYDHRQQANDKLGLFAMRIANLFDAEQLRKHQESYRNYSKSPLEFPNYYLQANVGSNRSINKTMELWVGAKIVDQLVSGVPIENVSTEMTFKDLSLLANSLAYAGPYKIVPKYDQNEFLYFELESPVLDQLIASGRLDKRNNYIANNIKDEVKTLVDVLNGALAEYQAQHREEINRFPHLFPEIKLQLNKTTDGSNP